MEKQRFYINTEGNADSGAKSKAIDHAIELAQTDLEISRIVLLIRSKNRDGWFKKVFDDSVMKKLFRGEKFMDCRVPIKIETIRTIRESHINKTSEIVVGFGLDSKQLFRLDDFYSIKIIILVPWLKEDVKKWVQTWNPIEISMKREPIKTFPEPSDVIKKAMNSLTSSINMSTGISHPTDEELAKTYILALHKYEWTLDADIVGSYLVKQLNWQSNDAAKIEKLINTLNEGRYFKGGKRTGLNDYYKSWKAKQE